MREAANEQPAPAVARVLRNPGRARALENAGELLAEPAAGVQGVAAARVERVVVDALELRVDGRERHGRVAQAALDPAAERGDDANRVERQHRHELPAFA
ncbi:MAG TPA: hypothetical protein VFZ00_20095 [Solirubrobacter sp.]|nr:hypothetical protein [Solirubrobacter sp.]